ncbi:docking protein 2 [Osmerus mordax]|uniref:docking protein 2 n=1 Tax=Osmerus mordax TaxID=8014 RepID=UPI0035100F5E
MEEDIRKQGMLFLQQQRFGKKWKRVWSVLYRESTCSISRMEFWECKDGGSGTMDRSDRNLKKQQEHKKVIRLSDCIRVTEMEAEGCPRDCTPFLVETTEKLFVFAVEMAGMDDWIQKLCEIAFPTNWVDRGGAKRNSIQRSNVEPPEQGMEDNLLYGGRDTVMDFRVVMRRTEASERCRLRGPCVLRTDANSLVLKDASTGEVLYNWPYRFLRRFGRDKLTFSFEAGRRCDSGEGSFEFDTKQGNAVFQAVEMAINLQRTSQPLRQASGSLDTEPAPQSRPLPQPGAEPGFYSTVKELGVQPSPSHQPGVPHARLEPPVDKLLTGVKSLTLDSRGSNPRKNQVKPICSCPLLNQESQTYSEITLPAERGGDKGEHTSLPPKTPSPKPPQDPEYSLPFDSLSKKIIADMATTQTFVHWVTEPGSDRPGCSDDEARDPLYDSIDELAVRALVPCRPDGTKPKYHRAEHIYDEPEGRAVVTQQHPGSTSLYDNPEEVRGNAWRSMGTVVDPNGHEYPYNPHVDDYAVPKPPKRAFPLGNQDSEEDSPYDNVMVKMDR